MPRPRFDKLPEKKRHAILEVAEEEFAQHGFENASFNRIIQRAGTTKGAMYYYFDDKLDLFHTVISGALARFMAHIGAQRGVPDLGPVETPEDFWAAVERIYGRVMSFWVENKNVAGLMRTVSRSRSQEASAPVEQLRTIARAQIEQLVRLGQRVGAVRQDLELDLMLHVLVSLLEAVDLWFVDQLETRSTEEVASEMPPVVVDILRRIGEPRPEEADRS